MTKISKSAIQLSNRDYHRETGKQKRLQIIDLQAHRVVPLGLEPKTVGLEGRCSIQLSYGTMLLEAVQRCENANALP